MKKIPLLLLLILFFKYSGAQNLTGRWQADSAKFSEGTENYQFFADGTFCFNVDEDEGLSRVLKIVGAFEITDSKLVFVPAYYIEVSGGELALTSDKPGTATWEFEDTKERKVPARKSKQHVAFKYYTKEGTEVLEVDGSKYYKVQSDPGKL
jgi:hypothetical protein